MLQLIIYRDSAGAAIPSILPSLTKYIKHPAVFDGKAAIVNSPISGHLVEYHKQPSICLL